MEDSGGSARAVASDSEGRLPSVSEGHLASDDEQDVDMHGPDDENEAGLASGVQPVAAASPPAGSAGLRRRGSSSGGNIASQEGFLTSEH